MESLHSPETPPKLQTNSSLSRDGQKIKNSAAVVVYIVGGNQKIVLKSMRPGVFSIRESRYMYI